MVRWVRQFGAGTSSSSEHDDDGDDALDDGEGMVMVMMPP
jgi:hypothetical protein